MYVYIKFKPMNSQKYEFIFVNSFTYEYMEEMKLTKSQ